MKITSEELSTRLSYPYELKVVWAKSRISEWYHEHSGNVYVAFSGGKDSTVLLHLVRSMFPDVPAVFCDTGLEFPEIRDFVKTIENVVWLKPKKDFLTIIRDYGFPVVSKENSQKISDIRNSKSQKTIDGRLYGDSKGNGKLPKKWHFLINAPFKISDRCCHYLKKEPAKRYEKETGRKPYIGTMVHESSLRKIQYLSTGCNNFQSKRPTSTPIAIWSESDIWLYIKDNQVPYSPIYDMGYNRTGCVFCGFGAHIDNRFEKLKETHPTLYNYCKNKVGIIDAIKYVKSRGVHRESN